MVRKPAVIRGLCGYGLTSLGTVDRHRFAEILLDRGRGWPDLIHRPPQVPSGHAEPLSPVSHFVLIINVDDRTGRDFASISVGAHLALPRHRCRGTTRGALRGNERPCALRPRR